jgi:DNA-binding NarL/FixJ family response regulator
MGLLARCTLGLVFLVAALGKIGHEDRFACAIAAYRLLPQRCGETGFFSRSVACRLAELCRGDAAQAKEEGLTVRERELLALIARGWDNARIARELCLARQTVRNDCSRLYARLGVRSRAEAIVWARERGLVQE